MIFDNIQSLKLDIKESHKELHAVSYRYIPTLEKLYFIAFENLYHIHSGNKILFSASTEYIAKCLNRDDKKKTGADISFLCLLGLIEKVDMDSDMYILQSNQKTAEFWLLLGIFIHSTIGVV